MLFAILFGNLLALFWIYLHRKQTYPARKIYKMLQRLPYRVLQAFRFLPAVNIVLMAWLIWNFSGIYSDIGTKYVVYGGVAIIEYLVHLIYFYTLKIMK